MEGKTGALQVSYNSRGVPTYFLEIWHSPLAKHRVIRGISPVLVESAARDQLRVWEEQWTAKKTAAHKTAQARLLLQDREQKKALAVRQTEEAQAVQRNLSETLKWTLTRNDAIDWEHLKDRMPFPEKELGLPQMPPRPPARPLPPQPNATQPEFQPQLSVADRLIPARRDFKINEANERYRQALRTWNEAKQATENHNALTEKTHQEQIQNLQKQHQRAVESRKQRLLTFLQQKEQQHQEVEQRKAHYLTGDPAAIQEYCDLVLSNSQYHDCFPKEWELDFNAETQLLLVDYFLPSADNLPTLIEVRYVATKDEFTEKHLTEVQTAKLYDDVLYQTVLRTIHELYEADVINAIQSIIFNGYVRSIDRATGHEISTCVLSLQANREEFLKINLAQIDPKACFKQLKGVGSSKLHSMAAVAPIVQMHRDDGRFVAAHSIAHQLDEGYNLAAMDWEDFEHLIREVFEQEFSQHGGEVKVTQASRDGGVDAIVFDPDPIRGGKIVIQAKRYTNTVDVSAVRDLYGTVMNEGATKGILVTTSDYGPDAYSFANGKPLTLLNGGNLLHLLEKHGHRARIDLQEARKISAQQTLRR